MRRLLLALLAGWLVYRLLLELERERTELELLRSELRELRGELELDKAELPDPPRLGVLRIA